MKWQKIMRTSHVRRFAQFLEEHPGFYPELVGEDAYICGFHVGSCFLTIQDMEKLVAAQLCIEAQSAAREELNHQQSRER